MVAERLVKHQQLAYGIEVESIVCGTERIVQPLNRAKGDGLLGILIPLPKIIVTIEEKGKTRCERIDIESFGASGFNVCQGIG